MSTNQPQRVRALRGATTVDSNDAAAIADATEELLAALIQRNEVDPDDLVSVIFTATSDLDAEFPAAAARHLGLAHVPLLCSVEVDVPGALSRCIRVLIHLYSGREPHELQHVYLREARGLRADLEPGPGQGAAPVDRDDPNARRGGVLSADEESPHRAELPAHGENPNPQGDV